MFDVNVDNGWTPISELRSRERVIVGRWARIGKSWTWEQAEAHWFMWHGEKHWSWGDQNPFTMREMPTHFHLLLAPPFNPEDPSCTMMTTVHARAEYSMR